VSTRSLKRLKRRLIPVLAIAAAIVPTSAQAQVMLESGSSTGSPSAAVRPDDRGARGLVYSQVAHRVSGLDQTRVIPGYNAPRIATATRPDDRSTRGSFVDDIQQPAPVTVAAPSGGISWSDASYGALLGFVAALALAGMAIGLRRQKHGELAV
jgi:hypothetical protein